ncbi:TPA: transcriptional regulator [Salmonella enterica]
MPVTKEILAAREAATLQGVTSFAPYSESWTPPTTDEVRALLSLANLSGSKAGILVGVESRTVRRWTGGNSSIPFACWAILVSYAGLGDIWTE